MTPREAFPLVPPHAPSAPLAKARFGRPPTAHCRALLGRSFVSVQSLPIVERPFAVPLTMPLAVDWHRATDGFQYRDVHDRSALRSLLMLEGARSVRFVIGKSNQFRLGVESVSLRRAHNRPSVYRQSADDVSRAATTGLMVSQLARVSTVFDLAKTINDS